MRHLTTILIITAAAPLLAEEGSLAFKPAGDGRFAFDTGLFRGQLRADGETQGVPRFVDVKTGTELAYGGGNPGLLSFYRLLSAGKRWGDMKTGDTFRGWPVETKLLSGGGVEIRWPPKPDHPVGMTATYRWTAPNTIDLDMAITPTIDMQQLDVFLSNYFNKTFENRVYLKPARHGRGKPAFVVPRGTDLVIGTYLAFPRDLAAARMFLDGRWEQGHNPVQWSILRYIEAPIGLMHDAKTDITFVMMARPEQCFSLEMPYVLDPPDGVAGHHSMYFSFFGRDTAAGQTRRASFRLVVDRGITEGRALELYQGFVDATK